jgi:hypothetical protein
MLKIIMAELAMNSNKLWKMGWRCPQNIQCKPWAYSDIIDDDKLHRTEPIRS